MEIKEGGKTSSTQYTKKRERKKKVVGILGRVAETTYIQADQGRTRREMWNIFSIANRKWSGCGKKGLQTKKPPKPEERRIKNMHVSKEQAEWLTRSIDRVVKCVHVHSWSRIPVGPICVLNLDRNAGKSQNLSGATGSSPSFACLANNYVFAFWWNHPTGEAAAAAPPAAVNRKEGRKKKDSTDHRVCQSPKASSSGFNRSYSTGCS